MANRKTKLTPAAGTRWTVEARGVRLLGAGGSTRFLPYPDAALWDFTTRGYPAERIKRLLAVIGNLEEDSAARLYDECVQNLVESGYLVKPDDE